MQLKALLLATMAAASLLAQSPAPPPAPTKITHVLATLTLKEGVTRDKIMNVMQTEVRDTVGLYLDGKIVQWYSRGDGKGVVFLLDCKSVEEARAILEKLPLIKGNFAQFDYMPLGPLNPLRLLLTPPTQ
jgi:hypothetical protein